MLAGLIDAIVHAGHTSSQAFPRLTELLSRWPISHSQRPASQPLDPARFPKTFLRQLAFAQRTPEPNRKVRTLIGREVIAAALMCDDPELTDAIERAGTTLPELRDAWFPFVTAFHSVSLQRTRRRIVA